MTQFPSVRIEGGLLSSDVLEQLTSNSLSGQKPEDFRLPASRNLSDEIALTFADARALWEVFQRRLTRLKDDDLATGITRDAWMIPFLGLLGFELTFNNRAYDIDGVSFAISHRSGESHDGPPVHIVGCRQALGLVPQSGKPRMAPHTLMQEFLNRDDRLWGLVTNGQTIRLLRDCSFVRRQAYIEFDLAGILEEKRFQDFSLLYRLLHRTRFPGEGRVASECLLETYYDHSEQQGGRIREHLREGVEECITLLANGFLGHADNHKLRQRVSRECAGNEHISEHELYRQLLTLIYRLLFLLVSEDRGILSHDALYHEHYGVGRLRRFLEQQSSLTSHDDIWQSLRVLWLVLVRDEPQPSLNGGTMAAALGLPVLNGDLFSSQFLDQCTISNAQLLEAFWHLAWYRARNNSPPSRVNYAALDVEELGSVYESLLEQHPYIDERSITDIRFDFARGGGRKETGSYYTPPSLVAELIKSALEPVLADRLSQCSNDKQRKQAILSIRVCDPACGSGHFLLAAARRLGRELAIVTTGEDEPTPEAIRVATREVISHCIYGVDRNQLAVDLCRVALWLESHTADKPLTFLDHRIRCGDSLIGVYDLAVLREGIPDKAFTVMEGDDKAFAKEMAKRNREERTGISDLAHMDFSESSFGLNQQSREVDAVPDDSPETIREKKRRFEASHKTPEWRRQKQACDLWTGAFFQPLRPDKPVITTESLRSFLTEKQVDPKALAVATSLSARQRFFHWPLEFPEVFADGGFDVVLSNPPWERLKLQEQEFFGPRDPSIANAQNKAVRGRMISSLSESNPKLYDEFIMEVRAASASSVFLRESHRFPFCGRGDINTYTVFSELCRDSVGAGGRAGIVVPSGIAFADTTKVFFDDLVSSGGLISLLSFFEIRKFFPATDSRDPFCLLTMTSTAETISEPASFVFDAKSVVEIHDEQKQFTLTSDEVELLNPNTRTCPIFRSRKDAELTKAIFRRVPVLWREERAGILEVNPWRLNFNRMFDMSSDSHHFRTADDLRADGYVLDGNIFVSSYDRYLPLYEAKMLHQFDHRWATYESATESRTVTLEEKRDPNFVVQPRYWIREEIVESAIPKYPEPLARAIQLEHEPSVNRILCWWAAACFVDHGDQTSANRLLDVENVDDREASVEKLLGEGTAEEVGQRLQHEFPLKQKDALRILRQPEHRPTIAADLVRELTPSWFLGWRDICRATDERTLITCVIPQVAVGNKVPLYNTPIGDALRLCLIGVLNSMVCDYCCRQKIGGTTFNFFLMKQIPVPSPSQLKTGAVPFIIDFVGWIAERARELSFTAVDLRCRSDFQWTEDRRFELRCELDAACMHLYLPADNNGAWRRSDAESSEVLQSLATQISTPREAVEHILDEFRHFRENEVSKYGAYRTKNRVLQVYDSMFAAQQAGIQYKSLPAE